MRRARHSERGASAVEFALILPLLLSVVFAIIDFGWWFFTDMHVTNAARDGARKGAVSDGTNTADAEARAEVVLSTSGLPNGAGSANATCEAGDTIRVVIDYPWTPLVGFLFLPNVILPSTVHAEATMHLDTGEPCS